MLFSIRFESRGILVVQLSAHTIQLVFRSSSNWWVATSSWSSSIELIEPVWELTECVSLETSSTLTRASTPPTAPSDWSFEASVPSELETSQPWLTCPTSDLSVSGRPARHKTHGNSGQLFRINQKLVKSIRNVFRNKTDTKPHVKGSYRNIRMKKWMLGVKRCTFSFIQHRRIWLTEGM